MLLRHIAMHSSFGGPEFEQNLCLPGYIYIMLSWIMCIEIFMDYLNLDSLDIVEIVEVILADFSSSICYLLVTSLLW